MANIKTQVDIKGFGSVIKGLSKISGKNFQTTLKAEMGHVFVNAIRNTPIAKSKSIIRHTMPQGMKYKGQEGNRLVTNHRGKNKHAGALVLASVGPRGGNIFAKPFPKKKRLLGRNLTGQDWISTALGGRGNSDGEFKRFVQEQKDKTNIRIARRGMSAGVFYFMGVKGMIPFPKTPKAHKQISSSVVRKTVAPTTRVKINGQGEQYSIMVESSGMQVAKHNNLQRKLTGAISQRIKFFKTNVRRGFTKDMKKFMPKNYPLLFN